MRSFPFLLVLQTFAGGILCGFSMGMTVVGTPVPGAIFAWFGVALLAYIVWVLISILPRGTRSGR
jgi:hypothetical protein